MNELVVGDFRINIKRSEIIYQKNITSLEPKVLKVLLLLAEKPGEIIPQSELLEKVWPGVIVEANTLQRCIAQLRKAFKDDAKTQKFITTHPRRGYSLVAPVDWKNTDIKKEKKHSKYLYWAVCCVFIIFALISGVTFFTSTSQSPLASFKYITPLTTTDETEFRVSFSPDGKYIAFQRYVGFQKSHIWAKNLTTNQEFLLTKNEGIYGRPKWSLDGTQIAFIQTSQTGHTQSPSPLKADSHIQLNKKVHTKMCHSIEVLTFALAKNIPQKTKTHLPCLSNKIYTLTWLAKNEVAFIFDDMHSSKVVSYKLSTQTSTTLYQNTEQTPYAVIYSAYHKKTAILQVDKKHISSLVILDNKEADFKTIALHIPDEFYQSSLGDIHWHPTEKKILLAYRHSLYEITLNGAFTQYPITTYQTIYDPVYHPNGKQIAATLGIADFDISQIQWQPNKEDKILYRSTMQESGAKYQPKGSGIAFVSNRSGHYQLWFDNGKEIQQLTHFDSKQKIKSFVWSLSGQSIILALNSQVKIINLKGEIENLNHDFEVLNIYQAIGNNQLLMKIVKEQSSELVLYNMSNSEIKSLYKKQLTWAQIDHKNRIFISDKQGNITIQNEAKDPLPVNLHGMLSHKRFLIDSDNLIINDSNGGIWQINLIEDHVKRLNDKDISAVRLDDINLEEQKLLYLRFIAGKKEIVLFN
ncbi:winged helix-turn-helix domain-containing protein [Pseudoalteromonas denitrificans]|uniref:DNA-binding winged helix-turn-helix (WHTH) domain-containing protein n=1 Tax=Pseudoalteromonas denitrificans DSM 6059 TaxID=1123010 RepID=A0A1I1IEC9_9GAMM|nr:winged helix-turn-helix domain-containing protein [Pseudoalteromonas denitrificans]SFC31570.1 DNA-binding winged helix-turn-helix (wHTH) domain-containing protein [Pseudoalteromonas denitrificans DSM 6059]